MSCDHDWRFLAVGRLVGLQRGIRGDRRSAGRYGHAGHHTATAGFTWMIVEGLFKGKPTVIGICSGAVAGLVAITPASGFVGPLGAFRIGVAAGRRVLLGLHWTQVHVRL
jgi:hypothetical protein